MTTPKWWPDGFRGEETDAEIFARVYRELHRMGHLRLRSRNATLQTTELVHEAYIRLRKYGRGWDDRRHFFRTAAKAMRQVLIDRARNHLAQKRRVPTPPLRLPTVATDNIDHLAVDAALCRLEESEARLVDVVELSFYLGLTRNEVGDILGVSTRTVTTYLTAAKSWLRNELGDESGPGLDEFLNARDHVRNLDARRVAGRDTPHVDGYRILRRLGRGGVGVVYLAVPSAAVGSRVALKLLKRYLATTSCAEGFSREKRLLSGLRHPNIVRSLSCGECDQGRPYLVMEYVHGGAITKFCDRNKLTIEQRASLFMQACRGVSYAHERNILHLDIKPSNILVSTRKGTVAKIIDFGIAQIRSDVGACPSCTPVYASPEQMRPERHVGRRSDVFSLGVVMYELMTGHRPDQAVATVRVDESPAGEVEALSPPLPSECVASDDKAIQRIAFDRGTSPKQLVQSLRDGMDEIAKNALQPDPELRYPSVAALLSEVGHWAAQRDSAASLFRA